MEKQLLKIINHFGITNQQKKLTEEIHELNEAITEYETAIVWVGDNYFDEYSTGDREEFIKHIAEEITDGMLLLYQIKEYYKISVEDIMKIAKSKTNRTLERIKNGYYEK